MKPILGPGGKLRGYVRTTGRGKELLSPGGSGYYNEETDQTLLPGATLYGYGDQLMDLLED